MGLQHLFLLLFLWFLFAHLLHISACPCAFTLLDRFENTTKCKDVLTRGIFSFHLRVEFIASIFYPTARLLIPYKWCDCPWDVHYIISFIEFLGGVAIIAGFIRWKQ